MPSIMKTRMQGLVLSMLFFLTLKNPVQAVAIAALPYTPTVIAAGSAATQVQVDGAFSIAAPFDAYGVTNAYAVVSAMSQSKTPTRRVYIGPVADSRMTFSSCKYWPPVKALIPFCECTDLVFDPTNLNLKISMTPPSPNVSAVFLQPGNCADSSINAPGVTCNAASAADQAGGCGTSTDSSAGSSGSGSSSGTGTGTGSAINSAAGQSGSTGGSGSAGSGSGSGTGSGGAGSGSGSAVSGSGSNGSGSGSADSRGGSTGSDTSSAGSGSGGAGSGSGGVGSGSGGVGSGSGGAVSGKGAGASASAGSSSSASGTSSHSSRTKTTGSAIMPLCLIGMFLVKHLA